MLEQLTVGDFESLLNAPLAFRAADGAFQLDLIGATPLNQPSPRPAPPFRLLLRSGEGRQLPQGCFELQHPAHGAMVVFMVPVQPDATGPCYEIIFN